jgi:hypothetical protein
VGTANMFFHPVNLEFPSLVSASTAVLKEMALMFYKGK